MKCALEIAIVVPLALIGGAVLMVVSILAFPIVACAFALDYLDWRRDQRAARAALDAATTLGARDMLARHWSGQH